MLAADNTLSAALDAHLALLVAEDAPLDWWRQMVRSGALAVIAVYAEGERVASVLWRLDVHGGERCFVICGAASDSPRFDLMGDVLPRLEAMAQRMGCKRFRFHTRRRGLVERASGMGYQAPEFVLLKDLAA